MANNKKTENKKTKNNSDNNVSLKTKIAIVACTAIMLIVVLCFCSILLYRQIFSHNPRFTLTKVIVDSNGYWNNKSHYLISQAKLNLNSDNIWQLDLQYLRNQALKLPGIEQCEVKRTVPDTIQFILIERVPRAQISNNKHFYIDSETIAIPKLRAMPVKGNLPTIIGVNSTVAFKSNEKTPALEFAMHLIMKTIRDFSEFEIVAIDVKDPDYYTMYLKYNGGKVKKVIIPVDPKQTDIKFIALRTAMAQAEVNQIEYSTFDLSFQDRVVCR